MTPDVKYESAEFQRWLTSEEEDDEDDDDCVECQQQKLEQERDMLMAHQQQNAEQDSSNVSKQPLVQFQHPHHHEKLSAGEHGQKPIKIPTQSMEQWTEHNTHLEHTKLPNYSITVQRQENRAAISSREAMKQLKIKQNKRLYNSWEGGLHRYHIEQDSDSDEEPLVFRFKIREHSKRKRPKTPPKSPFRETVLTDIENRRSDKIKQAFNFSFSKDMIRGKPVSGDTTTEINQIRKFNLPKEPSYLEKLRQAPKKKEFVPGMDKGSNIFTKKSGRIKMQRPFPEVVDEKPQLHRGKTIMRNPLAPVSFQQRLAPVVVLKSKLDDYTEAIREFLENVLDERRLSLEQKIPAPLTQSTESMVIYQDIEDVQQMKEMAKVLKHNFAKLNQKEAVKNSQSSLSFRSPSLMKGPAGVKKIGALDPLADPYRYKTPQKMSVGGQSVFLTAPNQPQEESARSTKDSKRRSKVHGKYVLLSDGMHMKTTSAPPNTPFEQKRKLALMNNDGE